MHTQAYHSGARRNISSELDRAELIESVMTLRQDLNSIAADVRAVLSENEKLKTELVRLQGRGDTRGPISEIMRMKKELDQLLDLHQAAAPKRNDYRQAPRRHDMETRGAVDSSWMKKMMMVMMLAEMV